MVACNVYMYTPGDITYTVDTSDMVYCPVVMIVVCTHSSYLQERFKLMIQLIHVYLEKFTLHRIRVNTIVYNDYAPGYILYTRCCVYQ